MVYITFNDGQSHSTVDLAAEFTDWTSVSMESTDDNQTFKLWRNLKPGKYMYKFLVDGQWALQDDLEIGKCITREKKK